MPPAPPALRPENETSPPGRESTAANGDAAGGERSRVLAPIITPEVPVIADQIRVATALARADDAPLSVVDLRSPAGATPTEHCSPRADAAADLLTWIVGQTPAERGRAGLFAGRGVGREIVRTADASGVGTLVLPGEAPTGLLGRDVTEHAATHVDCDVVVVNGRAGYEDVPSILLPVAGGPHAGVAVDVAGRVAADCDAWVDVLHVFEGDPDARSRATAERLVERARRRIGRPEKTATWTLDAADAADAIAEQSRYYGLTVIGAPTAGRFRRFVSGSTTGAIRSKARSVVLAARTSGRTQPLLDEY